MTERSDQSIRTATSTPPEPFLLGILHLLLSPFPAPLPPALLSHTTRQALHYLSISSDDEIYWTCGRIDDQVALRRRELVEAGNLDDVVLSHPRYAFDVDETKALVSLSLPHTGSSDSQSLGVVLVWEDQTSPLAAATGGPPGEASGASRTLGTVSNEDVRPGWTFLELQIVDDATFGTRSNSHWHSSLSEAIDAAASAIPGANGAGETNGSRQQFADAAGVSDHEGTTPGGIGTADDFWAGWSDDEKDKDELVSRGALGEGDQDDDEEDYWSSYAAVDSQVGGDEAFGDRANMQKASATEGAHAHRSSTVTPSTTGVASSANSGAFTQGVRGVPQHVPYSSASGPTAAARPSAERIVASPQRNLPPPPLGVTPARSSLPYAPNERSPRDLTPSIPAPAPPSTPPRTTSSSPARQTTPASNAAPSSSIWKAPSVALQSLASPLQRSPRKPLASPQRPTHGRHASDVAKALPSFPAFPVLPRTKSNSVLPSSGAYTVAAPAPSVPLVPTHDAAGPRSPVTGSEHTSRPVKTLPPAPMLAAPFQQEDHRPKTFAPQYANLIPVGPGAAAATSGNVVPGLRAAERPRQGSLSSPLPFTEKFASSIGGYNERHGEGTSSGGSSAEGSGSIAATPRPTFALPPVPPSEHREGESITGHLDLHETDDVEVTEDPAVGRRRLDRLESAESLESGLSIASTSLTGMLFGPRNGRSFSTAGGDGGRSRDFPLPPNRNEGVDGARDLGADRGAESLRFAMAGLWGLWIAGARTPAERDEQRIAFERIAGEVVRS